ncbi:MAG: relaxase/mobilization nuclease domain-containing protein [Ruminococcus flavefaciens]|nr:relaxase/mobilization nuclease domain-containing protein [Ruminococcus flavefaciens]
MGNKLIIKQVNKSYDTEEAIRNVLHYIVRDKDSPTKQEVHYWKAFGASRKNIGKACRQFIKIQKIAGKDSQKRIRHIVITFPPYVNDVRQVLIAADAVALFLFRDYQVVYGVHEKKHQLHIHFAVNPVSYRTLKKWHMSSDEFGKWKKDVLEVVNESYRDRYGIFGKLEL